MIKIEEEYIKHEIPEELKEKVIDPYVLVLNIDDVVKRLEKEEAQLLRRRKKNHIAQKFAFFTTDILRAEDEVYADMVDLVDDNLNLLIGITEIIDEDNYLELVKLVDFLVDQYLKNKEYYNSQLKVIDYATKGIVFVDNRKHNTHKMVKAFVTKKIIDMKAQKLLEKK